MSSASSSASSTSSSTSSHLSSLAAGVGIGVAGTAACFLLYRSLSSRSRPPSPTPSLSSSRSPDGTGVTARTQSEEEPPLDYDSLHPFVRKWVCPCSFTESDEDDADAPVVSCATQTGGSGGAGKAGPAGDADRECVIFTDPHGFSEKMERLVARGISQVKILSDFDRTLSGAYLGDGSPVTTSHGVMEASPYVPDDLRQQCIKYKDYYLPLEMSHELTREEKLLYCTEWWSTVHNLFCAYGITKSDVLKSVDCARLELREGVEEMLDIVCNHDIPFLVFTAGLADVIEIFLERKGLLTKCINCVGNRMRYDPETEKLVGFEDAIVHSLNKTYANVVQNTPFAERSRARKSVVLLGDNVHDSTMADGMPEDEMDVIVRIGFLNDRQFSNARLDHYKKHFDVVIIRDGPMDFVNDMLRQLAL